MTSNFLDSIKGLHGNTVLKKIYYHKIMFTNYGNTIMALITITVSLYPLNLYLTNIIGHRDHNKLLRNMIDN